MEITVCNFSQIYSYLVIMKFLALPADNLPD